ncbi:MAG TPA: hypothetical protein VF857_06330, partial [Spirochaetota bacterium]
EAAAAGFLDGNIYVLTEKGEIAYRGKTPAGTIVKSIALSDRATRLAVHYGNTEHDGVLCVNLENKKERAFALPVRKPMRTAIHVTDSGNIAILDGEQFIISSDDGEIISKTTLPPVKEGHSAIAFSRNIYSLSFRQKKGGSALYLFTREGLPIMTRSFPSESYLDTSIRGNTVIARGLDSLYAWNIE